MTAVLLLRQPDWCLGYRPVGEGHWLSSLSRCCCQGGRRTSLFALSVITDSHLGATQLPAQVEGRGVHSSVGICSSGVRDDVRTEDLGVLSTVSHAVDEGVKAFLGLQLDAVLHFSLIQGSASHDVLEVELDAALRCNGVEVVVLVKR